MHQKEEKIVERDSDLVLYSVTQLKMKDTQIVKQ